METIERFIAYKEEAYEKYENLKAINAPETDIEKARIIFKFWEVMELEEGTELGNLLYEFAVFVDFDFKLLVPIANKDVGFWSDLENMGFLDFNLHRFKLERSKQQISLLQSIDLSLKKLVDSTKPVTSTELPKVHTPKDMVTDPDEDPFTSFFKD